MLVKYLFQKIVDFKKRRCYTKFDPMKRLEGDNMVDVLDVARYIINYSNKENYGISNLRLQKLLYFVQAYYLAVTPDHRPCFSAPIEAWDFGPVVPAVYHEFKCYGSGSIPVIDSYYEFEGGGMWSVRCVPYDEEVIPESDRKMIREVVDQFADYSTTALVNLTHRQSPWKKAYSKNRSNVIPIDAIKEYFAN